MAGNPGARRDLIARIVDLEEQVRRLRISRKGHTETKTFLVTGQQVTTSVYIPPFFIGVDPDDLTPEFKVIVGFKAVLRTGTCTLTWQHNGNPILEGHSVTATQNEDDQDMTPNLQVFNGDTIRPVVTAASSAYDLSAAVYFVTAPL